MAVFNKNIIVLTSIVFYIIIVIVSCTVEENTQLSYYTHNQISTYSIEKEIEEMFKHLNKAVTDDITFNEVKIYVQETKKDKIDALLNYSLKYCNVDENGIICFNEIFNKIRLVDNAADVECLFKIFDHNSDRFLNAGELRNVINFIMHWNISRKEASCLIKDVIGYKKYKINNEELLRIIKRLKNV